MENAVIVRDHNVGLPASNEKFLVQFANEVDARGTVGVYATLEEAERGCASYQQWSTGTFIINAMLPLKDEFQILASPHSVPKAARDRSQLINHYAEAMGGAEQICYGKDQVAAVLQWLQAKYNLRKLPHKGVSLVSGYCDFYLSHDGELLVEVNHTLSILGEKTLISKLVQEANVVRDASIIARNNARNERRMARFRKKLA